jgi:hypothetical protein
VLVLELHVAEQGTDVPLVEGAEGLDGDVDEPFDVVALERSDADTRPSEFEESTRIARPYASR